MINGKQGDKLLHQRRNLVFEPGGETLHKRIGLQMVFVRAETGLSAFRGHILSLADLCAGALMMWQF